MSEARFCYRHPTSLARRKCFSCGRPLCPECQLKLDHHLFCSEPCNKNYVRELAAQRPRRFRRYALYSSIAVLVGGFIYFGLLADAFYSGGDQKSRPSLNEIAPSLPVETATVPHRSEGINITRPLNGMKSASQTVEVEGKAPANAIVAMYLNGSLVESTVARNSIYTFPRVVLT